MLLIRRTALLGLAAALLGVVAQPGRATAAQVVDSYTGWNGSSTISPFGYDNLGSATYGQTVTVPTGGDNVLEDFTFYIQAASPLKFEGFVYAWDSANNHATGPALFTSAPVSLTASSTYDPVTFNTGGLALTAGAQYVLFGSISNFYDNTQGSSNWAARFDGAYAGGKAVYAYNGGDFDALGTQSWSDFLPADYDMAFKATFDSPGGDVVPAVPEPASLFGAVVAVGAGMGCAWRRRKRVA